MSNTIQYVELNSICKFIDYRGKTPEKTSQGIPLITAKIVKNGRIEPYNEFIAESDYESWMRRGIPKAGDVILTTEAPLGEVAEVPGGKVAFAQRIIVLSPDRDKAIPRYIKYVLKSPNIQNDLQARASGTVVTGIRSSELQKIQIPLPNINRQKQIAKILGTLDDKIEIINQINETLESMAKAIFKEWFIDFGPVKAKAEGKKPFGMSDEVASLFPDSFEESELGQIPKGWKVNTIDDVCIFQNGYAFKSNLMTTDSKDGKRIFKMGNILKGGGFNADGSDDYYPKSETQGLERYLAKKGDLLMCMTDMKNNVALLGNTAIMPLSDEYLVNQRVGLLRSKNNNAANYPFLFLLTNEPVFLEELRGRANSGVQVNLSTDEIKKSKFTLPSEVVQKVFDRMVLPFFEKIELNRKESEYLSTTRDLLLPKLISGELLSSESASD